MLGKVSTVHVSKVAWAKVIAGCTGGSAFSDNITALEVVPVGVICAGSKDVVFSKFVASKLGPVITVFIVVVQGRSY